ncbi:MAG: ECF transporter S component [Treponema sp.]|nr:ECF transporter S component [Treponema sp.]
MKYYSNKNIHPATVAVWAAVVAAGHILPTIPILGTGGTFSLASALSPLSGIFFGPIAGALCSAAGSFIGNLIAPHTAWMGPFTFIVSMTTAFTTGCIAWGKWPPVTINRSGSFIVNGGIIVYIIGTVLWLSQETGRSIILFPVVKYGLGFFALTAGIIFAGRMFASSNRLLKFPAVWLCAFGGLIGGATVGNFFSLVLYQQPKEFWAALTIAAPIERAVFSLGAAVIGVPLLEGLKKIGIPVGPQQEEQEGKKDTETSV